MATKTVTKTTKKVTKKPAKDQWKKDLRAAYDTMAKSQIKQSNKAFTQALANEDTQALSRGMGRSSYTLANRANIQKEKVQAQNDIRAAIDAQYAQAVQQREDTLWQQQFQQAQFEAQQAQQAWQNAYQQDLFKYQYQIPAQQAAAAAQASPSPSYTPSNPTPTPASTGDTGSNSTWTDFWNGINGGNGTTASSGITAAANVLGAALSATNANKNKKSANPFKLQQIK